VNFSFVSGRKLSKFHDEIKITLEQDLAHVKISILNIKTWKFPKNSPVEIVFFDNFLSFKILP
jgi:hypothetical protein